jgi:hypothetical protein
MCGFSAPADIMSLGLCASVKSSECSAELECRTGCDGCDSVQNIVPNWSVELVVTIVTLFRM